LTTLSGLSDLLLRHANGLGHEGAVVHLGVVAHLGSFIKSRSEDSVNDRCHQAC